MLPKGHPDQDHDSPLRIIETVVAVNYQRKRNIAKKIVVACGGSVRGKTIALLGLAFKPNTDDMRDAPSISIVTALEASHAQCHLLHRPPFVRPRGGYFGDRDGMGRLPGTRHVNPIKATLATPTMIDLSNVYRPEDMLKRGFRYVSVGRT